MATEILTKNYNKRGKPTRFFFPSDTDKTNNKGANVQPDSCYLSTTTIGKL